MFVHAVVESLSRALRENMGHTNIAGCACVQAQAENALVAARGMDGQCASHATASAKRVLTALSLNITQVGSDAAPSL